MFMFVFQSFWLIKYNFFTVSSLDFSTKAHLGALFPNNIIFFSYLFSQLFILDSIFIIKLNFSNQ